ncbi:MAG: hypothetical protein ACLQVI_07610 [Polyangiaceae bacterium]|jgi:hypothetical protein
MRASLRIWVCASLLASFLAAIATVDCSSSSPPASPIDGSASFEDAGSAADASAAEDAWASDGAPCSFSAATAPTSSAPCNKCLQASCCIQVLTCVVDQACFDFYNCLVACEGNALPRDDADAGDAAVASCEAACQNGISAKALSQEHALFTSCSGPCATACN